MTLSAIHRRRGPKAAAGGRSISGAIVMIVAMLLFAATPVRGQAQLNLEANELRYDYDRGIVSALGDVFVTYLGYILTTERLTYYRDTGRLVAVGSVRIVDPQGTVYEAAEADVTDDFSAGFIRELTVVTRDATTFMAELATRGEGRTVFENGTYTACLIFPEHPDKPPLWQVRSQRIIHDEEAEMIYFERPSLEFFGFPVAWFPYFATPEPDVTRKTGFLVPEIDYGSGRGVGIGIPYFWAIAPNYDLTLTPTFYTAQGFMSQTEWRHRMEHGYYTIETAAIYQRDGSAFTDGTPGRSLRAGVTTSGDFELGRFVTFSWDGTLQTDRGFARDYDILANTQPFIVSDLTLTGLKGQSYFNSAAYYFQDTRTVANPRHEQARQAIVHPAFDFEHVFATPILGGELTVAGNLTSLTRGANDPFMIGLDTYYHGIAGTFTRASIETTWRREIISRSGMIFEPFAFAAGNLWFLDPTAPPPAMTPAATVATGMVGAGIEWRWPWLISAPGSQHVIEPVLQFVARPNEAMIGALPNNSSSSLVFSAANLLDWNRFPGGDRVEGGTRAVAALRYTGMFDSGWKIESIFGESFHIAGVNSYAVPDQAGVGLGTGLETSRSDFVGAFSLTGPNGNMFSTSGRFDETTFALQEAGLRATANFGRLMTSTGVAFDRSYFNLEGVDSTGLVLTSETSFQINDNWRVFGGFGYDFVSGTLISDRIGVAFDCDCLSLSVVYAEQRSPGSLTVDRSVMLSLSLKTLGDIGLSAAP